MPNSYGPTAATSAQRVSVAMAVRPNADPSHLRTALGSILAQSLRDFELLVLSACPRELVQIAPEAAADTRVRVIEVPANSNLSRAMNLAARHARAPLLARMDDDDWSHPDRLRLQVDFLDANPVIVAVGSWYERIDPVGGVQERIETPTNPAELRWRLLLGNCFAHGSMMLRRDALFAAGGYDESLDRGQDYDLWLRMSASGMALANVPRALYRHRFRGMRGGSHAPASDEAQANAAAAAMLRAWDALPERANDTGIERAMTLALRDPAAGERAIAELLTVHGPSRRLISAYTWARSLSGGAVRSAVEKAGRLALLRAACERAADQGARRVWLWGAGRHSEWVVRHADQLPVPIAGIVDDFRAGSVACGFAVRAPRTLAPGEHAVISSDAHEDDIWRASECIRRAGVVVHRVYLNEHHAGGVAVGAPGAAA